MPQYFGGVAAYFHRFNGHKSHAKINGIPQSFTPAKKMTVKV